MVGNHALKGNVCIFRNANQFKVKPVNRIVILHEHKKYFVINYDKNLIKLVYVLFMKINLNSTLINIRTKKLFCSFSRVKAPK